MTRHVLPATMSLAAALVAGCAATPISPPMSGFTCCNLRGSGGWVSSNNVQGGDLIPAGTSITLSSIKRQYYIYGQVGSAEYGFRDDSAASQQDTLGWARRLVVQHDPKSVARSWPQDVRTAIGVARVSVGMTREQVAMSLGYPSRADTPELSSSTWRYWTPVEDLPVDLKFADDGRLRELAGNAAAVQLIEFQR